MSEVVELEVNPKRGAGRFLRMSLEVTDEAVTFSEETLDPRGHKRLREQTGGCSYRAVKGVLQIAWRSEADRQVCIADQERRGRWKDVLRYKEMLGRGERPPCGPVYLHPSVRLAGGRTAREIDGTRRQLAALEANLTPIDVVVLIADLAENEESSLAG